MARTRFLLGRTHRWRNVQRAGLARGLLLAGVLLMLGLRTALAAYACTMPPATMGPDMATGAGARHAAMHGACAQTRHAAAERLRCTRHCASEATAPNDARPMTVPPNRLAAVPPAWPHATLHVPTAPGPARHYRRRERPPALPLLFCSLLI
jgi:hypothetical protein